MHIERLTLTNFRCFGAEPTTIVLNDTFVAFVGTNASGKTSALAALGRMFGMTTAQRRITREDFHIPKSESEAPLSRQLVIEAIVAFPELDVEAARQDAGELDGDSASPDEDLSAVPEFFRQMAATDEGSLKCRFRLEATWTDDGSVDGTIAEEARVIHTLNDNYTDGQSSLLRPMDRSRIQLVYVPATRDGAHHITTFLKSRLWKATQWSDELRTSITDAATAIGVQFRAEPVVAAIERAVSRRWGDLHPGPFETTPAFHPLESDLTELLNNTQLLFSPAPSGNVQRADQLSDGQRSLLYIALTAATLDIETSIAFGASTTDFNTDAIQLPALTLVAVEEPENSLAPHFLSRIVSQLLDIGGGNRAQALVSSQSPSVLGRVDPKAVRHFRLDASTQTSVVNAIALPPEDDKAATYIREAVQAYPELYFARFVVLGEGSSEEIVIPKLAAAAGIHIDQSFVAVVPLGGRHVRHMWRLLTSLQIPYVTLLDYDLGRSGGGTDRLKAVCRELEQLGVNPLEPFEHYTKSDQLDRIQNDDETLLIEQLATHGIFFCYPLDLDMSMLKAFGSAYRHLDEGATGPRNTPALNAVLGDGDKPDLYDETWDPSMQWYRYLFLGRSKPTTHLLALQRLKDSSLRDNMPAELRTIIDRIAVAVEN